MATLSHFPPHLLSLSSHNSQTTTSSFSFFTHHFHSHSNRRYCNSQQQQQYSIICLASSTKKPRASRKLMADDELRKVLREFVVSVGKPEGHVPSTKELSQHGRKDLANIVRRRGHKLIKELLSNSAETAIDGFDSATELDGDLNGNRDKKETGQGEKPNDIIKEQEDITLMDDSSAAGTSLVVKHESAFISIDESDMIKEQEDIPLMDDDSATGTSLVVNHEPPVSLQEKVENFMKYGQLEIVEDDMCGDLNLNDGGKISNHGQNLVEGEPVIHNEGDNLHVAHVSSNNVGQNGTLLLPRLISPPTKGKFTRDAQLSAEGPQNSDFDKHLHVEAGKMENEVEINHLKQMLHQKEVELSRLKEEIEREKHALSILQTKAEDEISKAQKIISEKDAELIAAEESLSGLVEAKIEYSGEGQMVEVAGSFNGWHHRIKLDPQPSSAIADPVESRKSRLWSATLWLYPGVYEIKFIVDGHWKVDPQRESTGKGSLENNILRVYR